MCRFVCLITFLIFWTLSCNIQSHVLYKNTNYEPYAFEDLINGTIEGVRPDIPDPLEIEFLNLTFPDEDGAAFTGNATLSNLNLQGLQSFQTSALNFAIVGMTLNVTLVFPAIHLFTDYTAEVIVSPLYIYGDGNFSVLLEEVVIEASARVNLTGGISVDNLRVQLQISNGTFEIHGLFDSEDFSSLITTALNEMVIELIDSNQGLISDFISPYLESIINDILKNAFKPTTVSTTDITDAVR